MAAASIAPGDPRIAPVLAMAEFRQKQGVVSPPVAKSAIQSLQKAPLMEEPFVLAALESLIRGDERRAEVLLAEARRRDPRSRVTRILLLDRHLRAGRVEQAAAEITTIGRLLPGTRKVLVPQLAKFAQDPKSRVSLAAVLKTDPGIREELLEHLASTGSDPDVVLGLARPITPGAGARWQQLLLDSLVKNGEVVRARQLWAGFAGGAAGAATTGVYDGNFQRLPGPAPFNWQFTSGPAGVAEPTKVSALQVEYYGRADIELASQLLLLPPGRHRLAFSASGDTPERGSSISWRLVCHPKGAELAAIPLTGLSYAPKRLSGDFVVPPGGCSAQWLRLVGTAAEFPTAHSLTISNVQIRPAGAS